MGIKRKANKYSSPPPEKRVTRTKSQVEVVIPQYNRSKLETPTKTRSVVETSSRSARRNVPTAVVHEDESDDDLDMISPRRREQLSPTKATFQSQRSSPTKSSVSSHSLSVSSKATNTARPKFLQKISASSVTETSPEPPSASASQRSKSATTTDLDGDALITSSTSTSVKGKGRAYTSESEATDEVDALLQDDEDEETFSTTNLSSRLHAYVVPQREAILRQLNNPPLHLPEKDSPLDALTALLRGSTERGEGNSCLILGSRGSGKSRVVDEALKNVADQKPVVIRLSAEAQSDDKLAMREMARQIVKQTGSSYILPTEDANDDKGEGSSALLSADTIPTTHLPTLIASLTTLSRPTIVILDAFDQFADHARQALLYCLLDTAQACRANGSSSKSSGLAVVGITSCLNVLNALEKRVKSRFSGRIIRVSPPSTLNDYMAVVNDILEAPIDPTTDVDFTIQKNELVEWKKGWSVRVNDFLTNKQTHRVLLDLFHLRKDIRTLCQVLILPVLRLSPNSPTLQPKFLKESFDAQVGPAPFAFLHELSYPCLALLVSSYHVANTGHDSFTFEMLWSNFSRHVQRTATVPVMVDGASVGMIKVPREVMLGAYETLIAIRAFQTAGTTANIARAFVKYRSAISQGEVVDLVEKTGNLKLRTWLKHSGE